MVIPSTTSGFNICQTSYTPWVVITSTTMAITSANTQRIYVVITSTTMAITSANKMLTGSNNISYHGNNISQPNLQLGGNNISHSWQ